MGRKRNRPVEVDQEKLRYGMDENLRAMPIKNLRKTALEGGEQTISVQTVKLIVNKRYILLTQKPTNTIFV